MSECNHPTCGDTCRREKKPKKVYYLKRTPTKRVAPKKAATISQTKKVMDDWYNEQRKDMKGVCCNCGGKTEKQNDKYFRWCIAHILPKAIFKSVATNEFNWMELCISCHTVYDRHWLSAAGMKCFQTAKQKFQLFKYAIAKEELRRIPMQMLETKEPL
jgi:hypothetical protein